MKRIRIGLTAASDRAPHVLAIAELLMRQGHEVAAILVSGVAPRPRPRREAAQELRQRMLAALGSRPAEQPDTSLLAEFMRRRAIPPAPLQVWARRHGARFLRTADLDDPQTIVAVRALRLDGVIYGGGRAIGPAFVEAVGGRILNAVSEPGAAMPGVIIGWIDSGVLVSTPLAHVPVPVRRDDGPAMVRERSAIVAVDALCRHANALRTARLPDHRFGRFTLPIRQLAMWADA